MYIFVQLNCENSTKSHTRHHPEHKKLILQDYFSFLRPADARLLFSIWCGTYDVKSLRPCQYAEGDVLCRLYGKADRPYNELLCDATKN